MLRYFIQQVHSSRFSSRMIICVPSGVTGVEQRAVQDAAEVRRGRKPARIIEEPMAAAIGAGLPVHEPTGNMIVDIGGGTAEVAMISLGGVVTSQSARVGDELDGAIIQYIRRVQPGARRTHRRGRPTAGIAWARAGAQAEDPRSRAWSPACPRRSSPRPRDPQGDRGPVSSIVGTVKVTLDKTPPELAADVMGAASCSPGRCPAQGPPHPTGPGDGHADPHRPRPLEAVALGSGMALEGSRRWSRPACLLTPRLTRCAPSRRDVARGTCCSSSACWRSP